MQSKGTKDLDASVPLMPLMRFISPVDSMWRSTVKVIEARLVEDTLIRRYEAERTHVAGGEVAHCVLILVHRIPLARVGSWKSLNYCLRNSGDTRIILGSTRKLVQAGNISVTSHGHAAPRADQYRNIWFKRLILRPDGKDRGKIPRLECLRRRHRIPLQPGRTPDSQKAGNDQRRLVRGSDNQQFRLPRMRRMIGGCPFAVGFECDQNSTERNTLSAELRQGHSDQGSSPCSTQPRSPSQTPSSSHHMHRLLRLLGAGSLNRRQGRHGCPTT